MIYDNIKNAKRYIDSIPLFQKAIDRLSELCAAESGRIELDGDKIYACVQHLSTAEIENCPNENHRRYIDVHYVIKGQERIDYWNRADCEPTTEFDVENDYELCTAPDIFSTAILNEGDFAIVYPDEVHRSKVCIGEVKPLHKIVFKVEY